MVTRASLSRAKVRPLSAGILEKVTKRFDFNIDRVNGLIENSSLDGIPGEVGRDILRAAAVLLHAAFEDALRNVLRLRLPYAGDEFLEKIYFDRRKRNTSITVAQLRQHAGKTVDALVGKR